MSVLKILGFVFIMLLMLSVRPQVGINTSTPAPGALLDINSDNKGLLVPRVALTDTQAYAPITPADPKTTGLLVYNTNENSPVPSDLTRDVTPGFYYWSGMEWRRFFNQGYTLEKRQTDEVRAIVNEKVLLPGLDTGSFSVPFSGLYQIIVNAYYSIGESTDSNGSSRDGAGQGSIILQVDQTNNDNFINLKETYVTSSSKYFSQTGEYMHHLGQSVTIILNRELQAGIIYQFRVMGEEWRINAAESGWFGKTTDTTDYPGSTTNDAQRGSISINLVRQY